MIWQVLPGKMTWILQRSGASKDLCFSLVLIGGETASALNNQGGEAQRESLDLEVVEGTQAARDELVDGLRLVCGGALGPGSEPASRRGSEVSEPGGSRRGSFNFFFRQEDSKRRLSAGLT